jgi:cytochrome c peroxidase
MASLASQVPTKISIIAFCFFVSTCLAEDLITPIPQIVDFNHAKAMLGKKLFSDPIMSADSTISCESCHQLDKGGIDHLPFSIGINQQLGSINAPTVFNAAFNFVQFWDGRAADLNEQARGPVENPLEMGDNFASVIRKLEQTPSYWQEFKKLYDDGVTENNIVEVISEFEKALFTPNSKFDKFLRGQKSSLSQIEIEGYELFHSFGCISCHNGVLLGGNMFQKFGVMKNYVDETMQLGRYNVTTAVQDKFSSPFLLLK